MIKVLTAFILLALFSCSPLSAGEIETITLTDIIRERDTSLLVGASEKDLAEYIPDGKLKNQILAFLVKVSGNEILFDAGLQDGHVAAELERSGFSPSGIKTILLTHLHPDHFGGLVSLDGKAQFPDAQIYVSKPEYDYWVNELKNENVINALALYSGKIHTFMFGDEVAAGVKAIDTTGHTPGHTSFLVEAGGQRLIVAGDIIHFIEIQLPVPDVAVVYDVDPIKAVQSRKFLLDYAALKNIPVAGMHIASPNIITVRKSGNGYEKY